MKMLSSRKFGERLVLTLDKELLNDFQNYTKVSDDGHVFEDAIVAMTSGKNSRRDVSVLFDGFSNVIGKELVIL